MLLFGEKGKIVIGSLLIRGQTEGDVNSLFKATFRKTLRTLIEPDGLYANKEKNSEEIDFATTWLVLTSVDVTHADLLCLGGENIPYAVVGLGNVEEADTNGTVVGNLEELAFLGEVNFKENMRDGQNDEKVL